MKAMVIANLLALLALAGCTHTNRQLNSVNVALEARTKNQTRASIRYLDGASCGDRNRDGCFVGLAISGGGSRSAVFASACMFELQRLGILEKVDYISAVSGGSLPATYYCVNDEQWNPGNTQKLMSHSFASDVALTLIQPWFYLAAVFSDYDRSDMLANSFKQTLFTRDGRELTFADLRDDRPRLLLNATDLQSGRGFTFTDETFNEINSDLRNFPLAYACAASSAVPVVLHQVTLRDYSTSWKQYRHLIDGGVNDNLGIISLLQTYEHHMTVADRTDPYPRGAVFIVIDARTRFDAQLSNKGDIGLIESLATGAGLTSTALLNRVSSHTLSDIILRFSPDHITAKVMRDEALQLEKTGYLELTDRKERPVRVVHLALSRLSDIQDLPFQSFSEKINSIATYFNIEPLEAYNLTKAADLLVRYKFEPKLVEMREKIAGISAPSAPSTAPVRMGPPPDSQPAPR
jgi:predicted acylesterase/phospholipase RssA